MIPLGPAIVVEGKYDKNRIKQIFQAVVIDTSGFGIFSDGQKLKLLRRLARERGIVVLTDPDSAGLLIRNFLKGSVQEGRVFHAFVPGLRGKERRKAAPGREGLLGVEGIDDSVIIEAVRRSGAMDVAARPQSTMTKADLYALGLSGGEGSRKRRTELCKALDLPQNLSANALLDVLNAISTPEELREI